MTLHLSNLFGRKGRCAAQPCDGSKPQRPDSLLIPIMELAIWQYFCEYEFFGKILLNTDSRIKSTIIYAKKIETFHQFLLKLTNKEFLCIGFYINLLSNGKSPVNKNVNAVANLARRKSHETSYSKSAKRSTSLLLFARVVITTHKI